MERNLYGHYYTTTTTTTVAYDISLLINIDIEREKAKKALIFYEKINAYAKERAQVISHRYPVLSVCLSFLHSYGTPFRDKSPGDQPSLPVSVCLFVFLTLLWYTI